MLLPSTLTRSKRPRGDRTSVRFCRSFFFQITIKSSDHPLHAFLSPHFPPCHAGAGRLLKILGPASRRLGSCCHESLPQGRALRQWHNIAAGLRTQHAVPGHPPTPRTTLKTHWKTIEKIIIRTRDSSGGENIAAALAHIESMACTPYANSGANLSHFYTTEENALAAHLTIAFNSSFSLDQVGGFSWDRASPSRLATPTRVARCRPRGLDRRILVPPPDATQLKAVVIDWQRDGSA